MSTTYIAFICNVPTAATAAVWRTIHKRGQKRKSEKSSKRFSTVISPVVSHPSTPSGSTELNFRDRNEIGCVIGDMAEPEIPPHFPAYLSPPPKQDNPINTPCFFTSIYNIDHRSSLCFSLTPCLSCRCCAPSILHHRSVPSRPSMMMACVCACVCVCADVCDIIGVDGRHMRDDIVTNGDG